MKRYLAPKHLPIPLGLIISLLGLIGGIFLINRVQYLGSQAFSAAAPQELKITNINNSSFVVSWFTTEKVEGAVSLGETKDLGEIRKDVRDREKSESVHSRVHFVLADNLKAETKYYFKIVSQGRQFDNSGKPFEVTTAPAKAPTDNDIAFGKILTPDQQPASEHVVFLSLANAVTQASLSDAEGHWLIPLSMARSLDLVDFAQYDREAQIEEIFVKGEQGTANATLTTGNDSPTPDIVLGQSYDFSKQLSSPTAIPTLPYGQGGEKETGLQAPSQLSPAAGLKLTINFPAENEEVNTVIPEFFGTGPESEKLTIEVESTEKIASQTNVNTQGEWSWSPNIPLSPGEHKVTISYIDANGIVQKVSRSFVVLAAGESDLPSFTATPSGEGVPATSTPKPTATLTPAQTSPTPSVVTPTPKVTTTASETETPASGTVWPSKFFLGAGLASFLLGAALIIF
ncbi:MAG TPA: fibronectin type III domain-containing protein [Clostridia bacterium]|nr:fibronectin type III domain-containing protein [Clostridia bacterium]